MLREPRFSHTIKIYFGAFSFAFDPSMPVLGGPMFRFNLRVYGKRYWRWKRKMKAMREKQRKGD